MEIELKYSLENIKGEKPLDNAEFFSEVVNVETVKNTEKTQRLVSIYYDTDDGILRKNFTAFRIRTADEGVVATLKWGGDSRQGLHIREEINRTLLQSYNADDLEKICRCPDISVFENCQTGKKIIELLNGKKLVRTVETDFTRHSWHIRFRDTLAEVCFDKGRISAAGKSEIIDELEVEILEGKVDDLKWLSDKLACICGIMPEVHSKYERGLALIAK